MNDSRHMPFRAQISGCISSLVLVAVLFGTGYQLTAQAQITTIPITVTPQVIQPVNGKLPASINLAVFERNCDDQTGIDLTLPENGAPYTLAITGSGLTPSSQPNRSKCTVTSVLTIDPNAPPGTYKVILADKDKKPVGSADITVLDNSAGPIPPGLAPQVDVLWEVMSQKNCSDVFGTRVAQRDYCVQLKVGNNSGYALQVAGIGFSTQLDALKNTRNEDGTVTIANSSYASTRAVLLTENVYNGRNILYNVLQAAGVLMAGFTPYFGTGKHPNGTVNNARTNWTTAASIVSGPLLSAFNIVAPNPVITQLNNLDDQSFRDSKIIPNNGQIQTVVFVEKQALTYQIGALSTQYPNLDQYVSQTATISESGKKAPGYSSHSATFKNSTDSRPMISLSRGGFSPFVVKLALGSVVIVGDQIQYLQRVQIQSNAAPSQVASPLTASPSSLSFGNQTLLNPSPSQSVTLTNTGSVSLTNIAPEFEHESIRFRSSIQHVPVQPCGCCHLCCLGRIHAVHNARCTRNSNGNTASVF